MKRELFVILLLLSLPLVIAQESREFIVGEIVYGLEQPYLNKKGIVQRYTESGLVVVRFEGVDSDVLTEEVSLTKIAKQNVTTFDVKDKGATVVLEQQYVRALYNDVQDYFETGTCEDRTRNQGETGIDCGGPCKLCDITPSDDVQRIQSFRSRQRTYLQSPIEAVFGTDLADAIPTSQLGETDVYRIAQAIRDSVWGEKVQDDLATVKESVEAVKTTQQEVKETADNIKVRVDTVNTNVNSVGEKVANIERPIPELKSELTRLRDAGETGSYLSIASIVVMIVAMGLIGYLTYMVLALKQELHQVTETTPEDIDRIVDYIQRMQSKGYEIAVIRKELVKEGFSRAAVDMAAKKIQV